MNINELMYNNIRNISHQVISSENSAPSEYIITFLKKLIYINDTFNISCLTIFSQRNIINRRHHYHLLYSARSEERRQPNASIIIMHITLMRVFLHLLHSYCIDFFYSRNSNHEPVYGRRKLDLMYIKL